MHTPILGAPFNVPDEFVQGFLKTGFTFRSHAVQQQLSLWLNSRERAIGLCAEPVIAPECGDRRFQDQEWRDNACFSLLKQRSYWVDGTLGDDPEQWLTSSQSVPGSWWTHWIDWVKPLAGKQIRARTRPGNPRHKPIERAPGRYVKVRAD